MFYVYLIRSEKDENCYVGSTKDLVRRFKKHNSGKVFSTRHRTPFRPVYYEAYSSEKDAREREQNLKNYGQGITNLYKRLQNSLKEGAG